MKDRILVVLIESMYDRIVNCQPAWLNFFGLTIVSGGRLVVFVLQIVNAQADQHITGDSFWYNHRIATDHVAQFTECILLTVSKAVGAGQDVSGMIRKLVLLFYKISNIKIET